MPEITALTPQKRNPDRVNLYLDGEFALGLSAEAATGFRVGQTLDESALADLQDRENFISARQSAFRYLSFRPRSIAEVRLNLLGKEYDEALVEQVIDYLIAHDYLDDEEFAAYWVEQREAFKPRSRYALRQELFQKGLSRSVIAQALQDVDETDAAERAARKRARRWIHLPFDEFQKKLGGYLQRRGFNYRIAKSTTEKIWNELTDEESLF